MLLNTGFPVLFAVLFWWGLDYLMCPAWNINDLDFWMCTLLALFAGYAAGTGRRFIWFAIHPKEMKRLHLKGKICRILLISGAVLASLMVIFMLLSSKLFHAREYSRILTVEEGVTEEIPSVEDTGSIALMDTASASRLGDREIGALSDVVSQYDIKDQDYMQVNDNGRPVKVAPLSYAGPFKWFNNKEKGVPGYVTVDPVSMSAEYIKLKEGEGMKYVPSAMFGDDLCRRIRRNYRNDLLYNLHFEIDDEGRPWYVVSVYEKSIFLFGGTKVTGVIIADPVTGEMNRCNITEVPEWVDIVFDGDLICDQYNDYARYQQGFWNAWIGQNGCRKTTTVEDAPDFGYIAKGTDIWIYTGVTSVNGDSSNIGFIMSNERTEETFYISCAGADESSAMSAAQGEVQEKGYTASFPSLVLVDGVPTYIMVLKDNAGLVKMYACVNVEQYNIVATASKQADCIARYKALLAGDISEEEANSDKAAAAEDEKVNTEGWEKKKIVVRRIAQIDRNGNTYVYIADESGNIFSARYEDVIELMLVSEGDSITILTDGERFAYPAE